jgi:hypothetical protein
LWRADRVNSIDKNPALTAFVAALGSEFVFGQVLIQTNGRGFDLRHAADNEVSAASLAPVAENELRALAQFTPEGAFRPLKSAPTLRRGWRAALPDTNALGAALNQLYPGAVADWFAAQSSHPPITSYREFTGRQTGMYRVTAKLSDAGAGAAIRACCHEDVCLKRRRWNVEGLPPDAPAAKSAIPCLEPCAILLEFVRKTARFKKDPRSSES